MASNTKDPVLVILQLSGGNDALKAGLFEGIIKIATGIVELNPLARRHGCNTETHTLSEYCLARIFLTLW